MCVGADVPTSSVFLKYIYSNSSCTALIYMHNLNCYNKKLIIIQRNVTSMSVTQ